MATRKHRSGKGELVVAILDKYDRLRSQLGSAAGTAVLVELAGLCAGYLRSQTSRVPLKSEVAGKDYFAFAEGNRMSRAVNSGLFIDDDRVLNGLLNHWAEDPQLQGLSAQERNRFLYTVAISFCAVSDVTADNDQKTPGTFFELLVGQLLSTSFGVKPRNQVEVLAVEDERTTLQTDFIFDLGPKQLKFHVPVKTSTRERAVQVWAHQRMLNGVYGEGRFKGLLVALAETKVDRKKLEVVEICLPAQWAVYQRFVARMDRVYYLDMPARYAELATVFPYIQVKTLGEFFHERARLVLPTSW